MGYDIGIYARPVAEDDPTAWAEFEAFLEALDANGDGQPLQEGSNLHKFYTNIISRFPCRSSLPEQDRETALSPWRSDVLPMFAQDHAQLDLNFASGTELVPAIAVLAFKLGLTVFDYPMGNIYRADGFERRTLDVDGKPLLFHPTEWQISSAVDALTPDGEPGFLALETTGEDYAQAAGGNGAFVVEVREYEGEAFRHFCAGRLNTDVLGDIDVPGAGAVQAGEKITAPEAKEILVEFARTGKRSTEYAWRDMTDQFE